MGKAITCCICDTPLRRADALYCPNRHAQYDTEDEESTNDQLKPVKGKKVKKANKRGPNHDSDESERDGSDRSGSDVVEASMNDWKPSKKTLERQAKWAAVTSSSHRATQANQLVDALKPSMNRMKEKARKKDAATKKAERRKGEYGYNPANDRTFKREVKIWLCERPPGKINYIGIPHLHRFDPDIDISTPELLHDFIMKSVLYAKGGKEHAQLLSKELVLDTDRKNGAKVKHLETEFELKQTVHLMVPVIPSRELEEDTGESIGDSPVKASPVKVKGKGKGKANDKRKGSRSASEKANIAIKKEILQANEEGMFASLIKQETIQERQLSPEANCSDGSADGTTPFLDTNDFFSFKSEPNVDEDTQSEDSLPSVHIVFTGGKRKAEDISTHGEEEESNSGTKAEVKTTRKTRSAKQPKPMASEELLGKGMRKKRAVKGKAVANLE